MNDGGRDMKARYREIDSQSQTLQDHLENVKSISGFFGKNLNLKQIAELAGLLHDFGKGTDSWQKYLEQSVNGHKNGNKDHATAGAQFIKHKISEKDSIVETAIQAVVMFHHGEGLPDMISLDGNSPFLKRLAKSADETGLEEVQKNIPIKMMEEIRTLINSDQVSDDGKNVLYKNCKVEGNNKKTFFNMGMHLRNLSSCLIDGDRTDSANFDLNKEFDYDEHSKIPYWDSLLQKLENHLASFENKGKLGEIRQNLSDRCSEFGQKEKGIYSCSAFTGAGKTLASLRFALSQAKKFGMKRIFIVAPYTSILDQNAQVIRDILEDADSKGKIVLECHSNMTAEKKQEMLDSNSEYDFAVQTWNAPVIVTTMVQFLESLFASGTKKIRRMHQIADSVLVFDEIQTLPIKCTYLFNWGLEYLVKCCGCSALLCTATQPGLDKIGEEKYRLKIESEVIENQAEHFKSLKRVDFVDMTNGGKEKVCAEDVSKYIQNEMQSLQSFLAVVNTKPQAKELYDLMKESGCADYIYHLSTNMCPAHRKNVFKEISNHLASNEKVVCISTRLIEAGVDLSFAGCLRYLAGLDSIIQTAGRCNRNNELKDESGNPLCGKCAIFDLEEENLGSLEELKIGQDCILRVLRDFHKDEDKFNKNLMHPDLIERYFSYFYGQFKQNKLQYKIEGKDSTILDLLSDNLISLREYIDRNGRNPKLPYNQAFNTAWRNFEVIADLTNGIIVPYKEGSNLIGEFSSLEKSDDEYFERIKELLRKSQQFTVNIYSNQLLNLERDGLIREVIEDFGIYVLNEGYYSEETGISREFVGMNNSIF